MNDLPVWDSHNVPVPELDTQPASWKTPKELRKERTEAGQIWHSNVKRRIPRTMNHGQTAQCKATDWYIPWYSHLFLVGNMKNILYMTIKRETNFTQNLHKTTLKSEREVRFNCVERHPAFIYWAFRQLIDLEQQYKQPISRSKAVCVKATLLLPSRKSKLDPNQVSQI